MVWGYQRENGREKRTPKHNKDQRLGDFVVCVCVSNLTVIHQSRSEVP